MWPKVTDQRLFATLMVVLVALAWLTLWVWGRSPYARFLSHHQLAEVRGGGALMLVFVAGWTVMIVAMMLPTSLPLVTLFHTIVRRRPDARQLVILLVAGYLGIWTLFGLLVYAGDWVLHEAVERSPWLEANAWVIGAATLVLAGVYQFTPLKYRCLDKCRSPLSFIMEHWQGERDHAQAFGLGVHHGIFCVGCCWSLMLLMFAVGIGNLGWMLVLGMLMGMEKNMPWGRRLSAPLGAVLVGWGLILVAG
ncbi:MAG: DUF2182 domain-containing protein [candidate division NC10 bacterium]|nr:DUF2182 domain-containing protein [candidate division NC10 bacterium]